MSDFNHVCIFSGVAVDRENAYVTLGTKRDIKLYRVRSFHAIHDLYHYSSFIAIPFGILQDAKANLNIKAKGVNFLSSEITVSTAD